jgi:hypothetical protein
MKDKIKINVHWKKEDTTEPFFLAQKTSSLK